MALVVAVWPNNTISILRVESGFTMLDLFAQIDVEASPLDATCYQIASDEDGMHITFNWTNFDDDGSAVMPTSKGLAIGKLFGKVRKLPWPDDILKQWMRELSRSARRQHFLESAQFLSAESIPRFPAPPDGQYTVCEVRRMKPFCGVYFAFNHDGSCHYIGESEDVTNRVSKSRPEIGDRLIGVIQCMPHERKRLEAYFVAMLDPPGNAASSHRMREKEAADGPHP